MAANPRWVGAKRVSHTLDTDGQREPSVAAAGCGGKARSRSDLQAEVAERGDSTLGFFSGRERQAE